MIDELENPAWLQERRHCAILIVARPSLLRWGDVIRPALLKALSMYADDDGIVRKSVAIYDNRGNCWAPMSFHHARGFDL